MATTGSIDKLKPRNATIGHIALYDVIYDTLVAGPSGAGQFVGDLAESWDISADGLVYTFNLRPDVKFHNGEPWNAERAIEVLEHYFMPENEHQHAATIGRIGTVLTSPDPLTLVFTLPEVFPGLLHSLVEIRMPYLAEADQGIGTGPFKVVDFTAGIGLVTERNEDFWGEAPKIDTYIVKQFADSAAAVIALEIGEVDGFIQPPWKRPFALPWTRTSSSSRGTRHESTSGMSKPEGRVH